MAWATMFTQIASQGGGTLMSNYSNMEYARLAKLAAARRAAELEFEAQQMEQDAQFSEAIGQQASFEQERQATLVASRAQAVAAASGGAGSRGVMRIISRIKGEGTYRGAVALYGAEDRARKLRMGATAKRYSGWVGEDVAAREAKLTAGLSLANAFIGAGSIYGKYGGGGPNGGGDSYKGYDGKNSWSGWNEGAGDSGYTGGGGDYNYGGGSALV